jgi:hypothetical protein
MVDHVHGATCFTIFCGIKRYVTSYSRKILTSFSWMCHTWFWEWLWYHESRRRWHPGKPPLRLRLTGRCSDLPAPAASSTFPHKSSLRAATSTSASTIYLDWKRGRPFSWPCEDGHSRISRRASGADSLVKILRGNLRGEAVVSGDHPRRHRLIRFRLILSGCSQIRLFGRVGMACGYSDSRQLSGVVLLVTSNGTWSSMEDLNQWGNKTGHPL